VSPPRVLARVNLDKPGKCAVLCNSDEPAVTVPRNGALTINCGRGQSDTALDRM
jgi:hypothetical protein